MYTKQEKLNKLMFDMSMMVIPRKFTAGYKKLYPYTNTMPDDYVPQFDSFDPHFLTESYDYIKNSTDIDRSEIGL
jgi:hypothetical protein